MYQSGFPDLFCAKRGYGQKWVEVKKPRDYSFTQAQCTDFPLLHSAGVGIWILCSDEDSEIVKLSKQPNWMEYYLRWVNNAHR